VDNLFRPEPARRPDELVEVLVRAGRIRLERIVSSGHATPPGQWLVQDQDEWVTVLQGRAALVFEGGPGPVEMVPGDYLIIPAARRHRVEWTDLDGPTVWLALHY
jgi:cupin 2 domain-containing protein